MTDYAAVPVQPIAAGVLSIDAAGNPQITGRGFSSVVRGSLSPGDFLLTMDEGTGAADIGSGPDFTVGVIGPNGLDPRFIRVSMMMRGGTTAPGSTTVTSKVAAFTSTPGEGVTQIRITTIDVAAFRDPMGFGVANAVGGGLEIMVWNGNAGPDNAQAVIIGPLFQGAMMFP